MSNLEEVQLKEKLFLGREVFSEYEYDLIIKECRDVIADKRAINTLGRASVVVNTLVAIIKQWQGSEDNFWDFIRKQLDVSDLNQGYLYDAIKSYFHVHNRVLYSSEYKTSYYSSLLAQALSPKETFFELFNLLYRVYKESLLEDYVENDSAFVVITENLASKIQSDDSLNNDESISIGSEVYRLKSSIKYMVLQDKERFISLVNEIMSFFNNSNSLPINDYLGILLREWKIKFEEEVALIEKNGKREYIRIDKWKPRYVLEDNEIIINVPYLRLDNFSSFSNYILEVNYPDSIESYSLIVGGTSLLKYVKPIILKLDLSKFFENEKLKINVRIFGDETLIFDSGSKINRDSIWFNNDREINSDNIVEGNYKIFTPFIEQIENYDVHYIDKMLYEIEVSSNQIIRLSEQTFFVMGKEESQLSTIDIAIGGKKVKRVSMLSDDDDIEYEVYENVDEIVIRNFLNRDLNAIFKVRFLESNEELVFDCLIYNETYCSFQLAGKIFDYEGRIKLSLIDKISGIRYKILNIYKLENCQIENYGKIMYGEKPFAVFNSKQYFNFLEKTIEFPIDLGTLVFKPKYFNWSFETFSNHNRPLTDFIWYEDIAVHSRLQIETNVEHPISIVVEDQSFDLINQSTDVSEIVSFLKPRLTSSDYFEVQLRIGNEYFRLFDITIKEKLTKNPIFEKIEDVLYYDFSNGFFGSKNQEFELIIENESLRKKYVVGILGSISEFDLIDGYYQIKLSKISTNVFLESNEIFFDETVLIGDDSISKFENKRVKLKKVSIDTKDRKNIKLDKHVIESIEYKGIDGFPHYHAKLKTKTRTEDVWFEVYNSAKLYLMKRNPHTDEKYLLNYDLEMKSLTKKQADNNKIFKIKDIYFEIGEEYNV